MKNRITTSTFDKSEVSHFIQNMPRAEIHVHMAGKPISRGLYCSDIVTVLRPLCSCAKLIEPDLDVADTSEPSTDTRKGADRNLFGTATVVRAFA